MNYIYDIILNFQERIYDFYEWNKTDVITHIRKIPVFKISSKDLYNIENYNVVLDDLFLEKILNKTEVFSGRTIKNIEYACILCDGLNVLAIKIDKKRYYFSKLIIEEELEVTESLARVKEIEIEYQLKEPKSKFKFLTRKEVEMESYVKKELKKLETNGEEEKLQYLYFECFGKKEFNMKDLYHYSACQKIYNILKLIQIHK